MTSLLRHLMGSRSVRVLATLLLLAVVLWKAQPGRLLSATAALGTGTLLLAAALTIPFLCIKTVRWLYLLHAGGCEASFGEAALSLIGGMGFALLTPARLGELARIAYLRDPRKLRLGGLVMLDKLFDVVVLTLLSSAGAWRILGPAPGGALLLAGCSGLGFLYLPRPFERALHRTSRRLPLRSRLIEAWGAVESLSLTSTTVCLVLTAASFLVVIAQFGIILRASVHLSVGVALLTFPLVILTNVLPLTVGGLGIREGTAALLLAYFHVATPVAVVSAFLMFFLNTALPGIVGTIALPFMRRDSPVVAAAGGWRVAGGSGDDSR